MKESTKTFWKEVFLTTGIAFCLISFLYIGSQALLGSLGSHGPETTLLQLFRYLFVKMFLGIFPFCLSLGFINRIFALKKSKALLRLYHFLLAMLSYFIFMVLVFNSFNLAWGFKGEVGRTIVYNIIPFFVFYPATVWVNRLGRAIFRLKEKTPFQSILD